MHSERELFIPPRSIQEFSELVPLPNEKTSKEMFHIENLANMVGYFSMADTIPSYLRYEERVLQSKEPNFDPTSGLVFEHQLLTSKNARSLSKEILSGMIIHYGLIHNERFSIPHNSPLSLSLPYQTISTAESGYILSRNRNRKIYEKSYAAFVNSLHLALPKTIQEDIEALF